MYPLTHAPTIYGWFTQVPDDFLAYLRLLNCQAEDAFHLEALFRDVAWQHFMDPV